jgi:hypothetical protein
MTESASCSHLIHAAHHMNKHDSDYYYPEAARPHCPKCQMRMITVPNPVPARFECLRCSYSEPTAQIRSVELS